MASDSGSGFIKRNRPPRVQIQYQDPYDSEKMVELPFVMGVMSDLSGNNPGVEKPAVEERSFADVTKDTIDDFMGSVQPGLTFTVENRLSPDSGSKLGVNLRFEKMDDLNPAEIARQVPTLRKLLEAREQLANLQRYIAAKPKAQEDVKRMLEDPELLAVMAAKLPKDDDDDGDKTGS
jgi:type VI secretion system protein ImpB